MHTFEMIVLKSNILSFRIKERNSCHVIVLKLLNYILKAKREIMASFEGL